jgi:lipopolysaccharide transport system ATP-binding protein
MSKPVISIEHLSKSYQLGTINTGTFYGDLKRWWAKQRGKPDPYQKIGEVNHGNRQGETLWALNEVNFQVQQGEALGIIGRNGAGKSTLLKILSRVTAPTSGEVKVKGRIASLLEVGTGFHPELTGRENIYLNGAIMGMSKAEVSRKFDEIVDFSGVEQFIDTPVKRYSSGMYVRLAFAVAAHLEPEILIVDEVLAVGDAEFQKKCLGKMDDVAHQGRTVLFVSHNMAAVKKLCTQGILLEHGSIVKSGTAEAIVEAYSSTQVSSQAFKPIRIDSLGIEIQKITLNENEKGVILPFRPLSIKIEIVAEKAVSGIGMQVIIASDAIEGTLFTSNTKQTKDMDVRLVPGMNKITCSISRFNLCSGRYKLGFGIDDPNISWHYLNFDIFGFDVKETMNGLWVTLPNYSRFYLDHEWIIHQDREKMVEQ